MYSKGGNCRKISLKPCLDSILKIECRKKILGAMVNLPEMSSSNFSEVSVILTDKQTKNFTTL